MADLFEIVPLGDRVIVRVVENTETKKNGIIIPEMAKERPLEGKVIAVGETATKVKPGDQILYGKYAGAEVKINDVAYLIMNQEDIIGIRRSAPPLEMDALKNGHVEVASAVPA